MRVTPADDRLTLEPETDEERALLAQWSARHGDAVFTIAGSAFVSLGPRAEVTREPVNVHSGAADPAVRSIGNLAAAPFMLDGQRYASVESFWQGLKFPEAERARIAALDGRAAFEAAKAHPYVATITYRGEMIAVGAWRHWRLMKRACWAKFTQHEASRRALLATLPRPIEHRPRTDSKAIPGAIMAEIWMRIRDALAAAGDGPYPEDCTEE